MARAPAMRTGRTESSESFVKRLRLNDRCDNGWIIESLCSLWQAPRVNVSMFFMEPRFSNPLDAARAGICWPALT